MMASQRLRETSSGVNSGSGLAMAELIGFGALERFLSYLTAPFFLKP